VPVTTCPEHGKPSYSSWGLADKVRHRSNVRNGRDDDEGSVYFCCESGGYHVTSWDRHDQDRFVAGHPPIVHNPGDIPLDVGGQEIGRTISVDCSGASTRNLASPGIETLLVGPAVRGDSERKFGGPTLARADRLKLSDETTPRRESAVTLPAEARLDAPAQDDTPIVIPSERPSHGDDVRPWDGWDDDERDVAS